jgi:hypothetical protein
MTLLHEDQSEHVEPKDFATELTEALAPLRMGLSRMLAEWGSPKSPSELDKLSGAGFTNCWRVFQVVGSGDFLSRVGRAPTPSSLKLLLAAGTRQGVKPQTAQNVERAAREFQQFVKRNAKDRAAFESMLAGISGDESTEKIQMSQRRGAYRNLSHIWGIQVDLQFGCLMARRSADGAAADMVRLHSLRGIRRLRPGSQITLFAYHQNPSFTPGAMQMEGAIDAEAAARYEMPLLPQFCTDPVPPVEKIVLPSGWVTYNTVGSDIGPRADIGCAFGRIVRDAPFMIDVGAIGGGRRLFHSTLNHTRKPVEMLIQELLVHRDSFPGIRPELIVYQYSEGERTQESARRAMQFPVDEKLTNEGRADRAELADVPNYARMLRLGADAAGWDLAEFDVYRVRMPYPIMFSATRIFFYVD